MINGPASQQLGTDNDNLPKKLRAVDFDLGIITGDRSINPFLSLIILGTDDGKVSVNNAPLNSILHGFDMVFLMYLLKQMSANAHQDVIHICYQAKMYDNIFA